MVPQPRLRSFTAALGLICTGLLATSTSCTAQPLSSKKVFTHQDTLRGSITPERAWWNVLKYAITVEPDYNAKSIKGTNTISFAVLQSNSKMQIDLQQPMELISAKWNNTDIPFKRNGNVFYLSFPNALPTGTTQQITLEFGGKPREAVRPPWDGGWIWRKDAKGNPWMSVACQGLGASVWYPCKDHQSDEPDQGAALSIIVPDDLVAIGNGKLASKEATGNAKTKYDWVVINPINSYNIVPYIGKYAYFGEVYEGEKGRLQCDYWVIDANLEKAKEQFKQVPQMMKCFEHWFGPYPFYEDSYKLVESPHLGMEHQSAVAYGNKYQNGYLGNDLSGSGWGKKWDFILIHESGHEWFANNITTNDIADMWVHEGFTNYSESLFTECEYGKQAGSEYVIGLRKNISNDIPVEGPYGVNQEGSGDMYYKGANMIHTIRQIIDNDELFRDILRGLNKEFYHKTVTARQVEEYINKRSGKDFSKVYEQYLRTTKIPVLEYKSKKGNIEYKWTNVVDGFDMPVKVDLGGRTQFIQPTTKWESLKLADWYTGETFKVDSNFYVTAKRVK
ncbi:M1 family metallopeptidase [Pseudoflavitalea rhizosphaerae]|uniref:M1 family metallopeptidase n=1 Tax=Pseudoflavitalea rhizosphaerae TaxID=1884793 RepID=UPI000F8F12D6|nr:M1 family metallopeptidase [Pseudoflavitalea rhizosphaerae]